MSRLAQKCVYRMAESGHPSLVERWRLRVAILRVPGYSGALCHTEEFMNAGCPGVALRFARSLFRAFGFPNSAIDGCSVQPQGYKMYFRNKAEMHHYVTKLPLSECFVTC